MSCVGLAASLFDNRGDNRDMNQLDALKLYSTVVADTGDFQQISRFQPQDATTNPSLILKAVQMPAYAQLLQDTRTQHAGGIDPSRVLIKIAATWEGIQAAAKLEREGIHTNLTLLFSFTQALACADAGVKLISPFVGRIYDWYKKTAGAQWDEAAQAGAHDPGVQSVCRIYNYYKKHGIHTEVMGASFRNTGQIIALAGCDLLTISPELLAQLQSTELAVQPALSRDKAIDMVLPEVHLNESSFRFAMNEDAMATEKLAEGIRAFCADAHKLDQLLSA